MSAGKPKDYLPFDVDLEQQVIGSILLENDLIDTISEVLDPAHFYDPFHQRIYEMVCYLRTEGAVTPKILHAVMKNDPAAQEMDIRSYFCALHDSASAFAPVREYGRILKDLAARRSLIKLGEELIAAQGDGPQVESTAAITDRAADILGEIVDGTREGARRRPMGAADAIYGLGKKIENHQTGTVVHGYKTGIDFVDKHVGALMPGDIWFAGARPGMAKSQLATNIARNVAMQGMSSDYYCPEMTLDQLAARIACEVDYDRCAAEQLKPMPYRDFIQLRANTASVERLAMAARRLTEWAPIDLFTASMTLEWIEANSRRRARKYPGHRLLIIDHLQLVTVQNLRRGANRTEEQTIITKRLKELAKEIGWTILVLSQLNRSIEEREDKRPRMQDFREGGCVTGDTLIVRADTGIRCAIKDLVGEKDVPIFTLDEKYKLQKVTAKKFFFSGRKKVFILETRSGRKIKASANHPFLTIDGWHRLDTLICGTKIAVAREIKIGLAQKSLSRDELTLLAHLLGDGCVLPGQPIHYTSADQENLSAVESAAASIFGIVPRRVKQGNWWHSYLPSPFRLAPGRKHPITNWFLSLGIDSVHSYDKRIPDAVFGGDDESISHFLRHLWATDGNISWTKNIGRKRGASIYYCSTSAALAEGVMHLLLRLGIWSSLKMKRQKKYRPIYWVVVQGVIPQIKFLEIVGCNGARGLIIPAILSALKNIVAAPNTDVIPKDVWRSIIRNAKEAAGISWRNLAAQIGVQYSGSSMLKYGPTRQKLKLIAAVLRDDKLKNLSTSDVYWDEIVAITYVGIEDVFDATVPPHHNFVANDIVIHNSIEQDADVVIGLVRLIRYASEKIKQAKNEEQRTVAIGEYDALIGVLSVAVLKNRSGGEADYHDVFIDEKSSAIRNEAGAMTTLDVELPF